MASIIYMTDFAEAYARGLLLGMARYANDIGEAWNICRLPLSIRDKFGVQAVVDYAHDHHVDAVIGQFNPTDDVSLFGQKGILVLAQDFKTPFTSIPNIRGEYRKSGEMAAEYFVGKGFRNFGFYGVKHVCWSEDRRKGFLDVISRKVPGYSFYDMEMLKTDMWNYDVAGTARWLGSLPKPVAIMACDDNHAYYLTESCRIMSSMSGSGAGLRIPEDIAILGVDNDETICNLSSVKLSSINQDVERGGVEVARYIDQCLKHGQTEILNITVPATHIVTRQSSDIFVNDDPFIAKVLRYIHENVGRKTSVDDIVSQVPLSRRLLEERFRKVMGTSIYNYVLKVRVEKVAERLSGGAAVSDAAFEFGFSDIKNLSRVFRNFMGMSPSEYKESRKMR